MRSLTGSTYAYLISHPSHIRARIYKSTFIQVLAKAEKSHAGKFQRTLNEIAK